MGYCCICKVNGWILKAGKQHGKQYWKWNSSIDSTINIIEKETLKKNVDKVWSQPSTISQVLLFLVGRFNVLILFVAKLPT